MTLIPADLGERILELARIAALMHSDAQVELDTEVVVEEAIARVD